MIMMMSLLLLLLLLLKVLSAAELARLTDMILVRWLANFSLSARELLSCLWAQNFRESPARQAPAESRSSRV